MWCPYKHNASRIDSTAENVTNCTGEETVRRKLSKSINESSRLRQKRYLEAHFTANFQQTKCSD